MKVAVNIKAGNPKSAVSDQENYTTTGSPDSGNDGFLLEVDFEFLFDVIKYVDLKDSEFYLPVVYPSLRLVKL